jgi:hypothetical protein
MEIIKQLRLDLHPLPSMVLTTPSARLLQGSADQ